MDITVYLIEAREQFRPNEMIGFKSDQDFAIFDVIRQKKYIICNVILYGKDTNLNCIC